MFVFINNNNNSNLIDKYVKHSQKLPTELSAVALGSYHNST
jgi:hypothetical protein